jgi:hypothetical protein
VAKKDSSLHGFGWIAQVIVGAVQGVALGVSDGLELAATKKYLKENKRTQSKLQATLLANKRKELENRAGILGIKGETELLRDQKTKKLVIMGVVTTIAIAIVALVVIYWVAVGGDDDTITVDLDEFEDEFEEE